MLARAVALVALLLPAVASAQYDPNQPSPRAPPPALAPSAYGPGETGFTLGARLGYGAPTGEISGDGDPRLDELVEWKLPVGFELGYRFSPAVRGGLYLEYAPVYASSRFCVDGLAGGCDGSSVRFGVDLQHHLAPRRPVDPWIGIGFGAEFLSVEAYDRSVDRESTFGYAGLEVPLEAGLDLFVTPRFTLGPFVSWTVAWFTSYSVETSGFEDLSGAIRDRTLHGWLEAGVKGTYRF